MRWDGVFGSRISTLPVNIATISEMEQLGDVFEGEWASLSGMYTNTEESEFMTQLLGEFSPETEFGGECLSFFAGQSNFWPAQTSANVASIVDEDSFVYSSDPSTSNVCFSPQETSTYSGSDANSDITNLLLNSSQGTLYQPGDSDQSFATNDIPCYYNSVDFSFGEEEDMSITAQVCTDLMMLEDEGSTLLKKSSTFEAEVGENISNSVAFRGTKLETQVLDNAADEKVTKKRPHNAEAQNNKRNVKPRKSKKVAEITNIDESKGGCGVLLTQTSASNCLKNDASAPLATEEFSNLTTEDSPPPCRKGKTRANRGSATDPQSLYARKRREKINERLRILQGLVPNGTKVDISTMLDEAVQYVKFLQLQIKLLSSDDMWMYAPLAYNGMDLGLDLKM